VPRHWLEPLEPRHAEGLADAATPELFTYHFPPPEFSPAGFRAMIQYLLSQGTYRPFAILARETEPELARMHVVGTVSDIDVSRSPAFIVDYLRRALGESQSSVG